MRPSHIAVSLVTAPCLVQEDLAVEELNHTNTEHYSVFNSDISVFNCDILYSL